MTVKKKPSAKARQTKSAAAPKSVAAAPKAKAVKPEAASGVGEMEHRPRSLLPVWIGLVVIIAGLIALRYGGQIRTPEWNWPEIPSFSLPEMPEFSAPELPHFVLPEMPELPEFPDLSPLSKLFSWEHKNPVEEVKELPEPEAELGREPEADTDTDTDTDTEMEAAPAVPPLPEAALKAERELAVMKRQLLEAEERVLQLESIVQEKDRAIQYEVALRGKSLLAQYARLIEYALEKGFPFPWELEQLQRFVDGSRMPEAVGLVKALAPYAQGVSSMEKLHQDFEAVSAEVYLRWKKEETGSGVSAVFWRMVHQVISIRKVGLVEGDAPEAVMARAEYHLNKGDVAQAYQELAAFRGSYASIVRPWMEEAALRIEAMKFIKKLHDLAQKAAPGTVPSPVDETYPVNDLAEPLAESPIQPLKP